jgi:hypothetical protein
VPHVETIARSVRAALATAIVVALTDQFFFGADLPTFRTVNFFSYFTVLSNISAAAVLGALAVRPALARDHAMSVARGAVTLYMTVTGLVYAVLLAPAAADVSVNLKWVDVVVHQIAPVVVLADYALLPPSRRPTWLHTATWLGFPAVWLVYTLVRGPRADWYPYPFLDPAESSTAEIIVSCIGIFAVLLALAVAIRWWAGRRLRPVGPRPVALAGD